LPVATLPIFSGGLAKWGRTTTLLVPGGWNSVESDIANFANSAHPTGLIDFS